MDSPANRLSASASLIADLTSLRRRVNALASEADAIGMLCHDEFGAISEKTRREIRRVKDLDTTEAALAAYDEVDNDAE